MRILVTNDDGIHSPGLAVTEAIARNLSDDVWVVAPENEQSGASHSLTLTSPLRLRTLEERRYAVSGTPTDCVHLAVTGLLEELPDVVISGINYGANMGDDTIYSGTVAAATEGFLLGIPSVAISLVAEGGGHFETAARIAWATVNKRTGGGAKKRSGGAKKHSHA